MSFINNKIVFIWSIENKILIQTKFNPDVTCSKFTSHTHKHTCRLSAGAIAEADLSRHRLDLALHLFIH